MSVSPKMQVAAFGALVLGGSAAVSLASRGVDRLSPGGEAFGLVMMWLPALSAAAVMLLSEGTLKGLGWKPGRARWLAGGFLAPIIYIVGAFAAAALAGAGTFDLAGWREGGAGRMAALLLPASVTAIGGEIGWRGFLAPRLASIGGFWLAVNGGALLWFACHLPALMIGGYSPGHLPIVWTLTVSGLMIWTASLFHTWLRVRSGSFWPAALSQAAHVSFIQIMLVGGFASNGRTPWVAGEFGIATALLMAVLSLAVALRFPVDEGKPQSSLGKLLPRR